MPKKILFFLIIFSLITPFILKASSEINDFKARPPIHIYGKSSVSSSGLTPQQIKTAYHLPQTGGNGTIAIIVAYDDQTIEKDLNVFSKNFHLPACTISNSCLEKHTMDGTTSYDAGWALETSLDTEWAHAIAPSAKILLVEARTSSGKNLLDAVDYARSRADVVAISMSWGGKEFRSETSLDEHFQSTKDITFFASSGDKGNGASWPAVSPYVVAVGGTSLSFLSDGLSVKNETAWSGSGGGISSIEKEPAYQLSYDIKKAKGMRAIPDVAFNADPKTGYSVYRSLPYSSSLKNWYVIGGTSAGAPQWAAIKALGGSASNKKFYEDKAKDNNNAYFKDIISGSNGNCSYYCAARQHYDYVTGLGSPLSYLF
jgi:subtilase family serine protease